MTEHTNPAGEKQFAELIGRIFSDPKFAQAMEHDPEKALRDAGVKLDDHHVKALHAGTANIRNVAAEASNTAAFVRPVVSVLTKGTRPAVSVVVSSAVVASSAQAKDDKR